MSRKELEGRAFKPKFALVYPGYLLIFRASATSNSPSSHQTIIGFTQRAPSSRISEWGEVLNTPVKEVVSFYSINAYMAFSLVQQMLQTTSKSNQTIHDSDGCWIEFFDVAQVSLKALQLLLTKTAQVARLSMCDTSISLDKLSRVGKKYSIPVVGVRDKLKMVTNIENGLLFTGSKFGSFRTGDITKAKLFNIIQNKYVRFNQTAQSNSSSSSSSALSVVVASMWASAANIALQSANSTTTTTTDTTTSLSSSSSSSSSSFSSDTTSAADQEQSSSSSSSSSSFSSSSSSSSCESSSSGVVALSSSAPSWSDIPLSSSTSISVFSSSSDDRFSSSSS
eukprot:TRINITY_DN74_c0_g5_i2.p1 TRINITY_DN74_c0_g5~~TRINITY_DN74_c0_g5_i2.p1  ORF type:complete len:338 (-),score=143.73 TRINITY_DN74_c0_g5_i2:147-1160(-)